MAMARGRHNYRRHESIRRPEVVRIFLPTMLVAFADCCGFEAKFPRVSGSEKILRSSYYVTRTCVMIPCDCKVKPN